MAKKRKKRRRRLGLLALIALAVLIAGFVVRRMLMPQAIHYLAYRPPDSGVIAPASNAQPAPMPSENLSASDRQQLDDTLKRKAR
ncbi:MAG: hypothetical protein ACREQR_16580 [Candidatus Binataceae bacterium]